MLRKSNSRKRIRQRGGDPCAATTKDVCKKTFFGSDSHCRQSLCNCARVQASASAESAVRKPLPQHAAACIRGDKKMN